MKQLEISRTASWIGWGIVAVLATLTGLFALRFLTFNPATVTEELRQNLVDHPVFFYTHTLIAPLAMLVGVWQFLPASRRSAYHRWAGRFYVVCVVIASVAGFRIALTTEAGPLAGVGFMILAVLWFAATVIAYRLARAGDFDTHRIWMIRSYALTTAAITLRLMLPIGLIIGARFETIYTIAAWGSWIINLAIAEWIIRQNGYRRSKTARAV